MVICTRNRADDLRRTLASVEAQHVPEGTGVVVVDASDPEAAALNRVLVERLSGEAVYLPFPGTPSLARQRNYAVARLPETVSLVHFLDDDVTLMPGYFEHLVAALTNDPEAGGAGGVIVSSPGLAAAPGGRLRSVLHYLFCLDAPRPGRVLRSGRISGYDLPERSEPFPTQWLSGCASTYRRRLLLEHPVDERLEGYSFMEDRDFSYRIARRHRLLAVPAARLVHHQSPLNRHAARRMAMEEVVHRYWFVRKNVPGLLGWLCYGWSLVGALLAIASSRRPYRREALAGFAEGLQRLARSDHPLLRDAVIEKVKW